MRLKITDIAKITDGELIANNKGEFFEGFSIDSRTIRSGQCFIAISGENFNGHDFIPDVVKNGANGIIAERTAVDPGKYSDIHIILVDDTKKAMGRIAAEKRRRVDIPVICITGTSGKTTVKDMLSHLLAADRKVLCSRRSYNNIIGLSLTLFDLDESHEAAVLEIGTNHPGEIRELVEIARPNMIIITNIGDGHLEFFGDRGNVFKEKISSLEALSDGGLVILNGDDVFLGGVVPSGKERIKFYGKNDESDLVVSNISRNRTGFDFFLGDILYKTPLEGEHNIYNVSAALAAAMDLGVSVKMLQERVRSISLPEGRLEKVIVEGIEFIKDSYNANPGSFESALSVLESKEAMVKGVVAGDMMELGDKSEMWHRKIGSSIAEKNIDFLITLGANARHVAKGAIDAGMPEDNIYSARDHKDVSEKMKKICPPDSVVLLKGSRRSKMEEVIKCFTNYCIH